MPKGAIEVAEASEGDLGVVTLSYQRYDVVPPACPGWTQPLDYNFANATDPNLGCPMWHNAAVMAADPADLVTPQPLASEDPNVMQRVDSAYRQGNATELHKNAIQSNHDTSAAVAVSTSSQTTGQSNTAGVAPTTTTTTTPTTP